MALDYEYTCTLVRVTDGDTIVLDVDLGFRMRAILPIRLLGLNAAELRQPEGKATRAWVIDWFATHPTCRVATLKDPEKYGRWLGVVTPTDDGAVSLNEALVDAGLALPYDGKGPMPTF